MNKLKLMTAAIIAGGCLFTVQSALAYSAGDIFVRGGVAKSEPDGSDNGDIQGSDLTIKDETGFTYGLGYLFTDKVGVELGGSEKFEHDLRLNGADAESVDRMPVNLMVNYYPLGGMDSRVQPYVGAGVNYTRFSGEPGDLDVDSSYGAVGQLGVDLAVTDNVMLNGFANYADVDGDIEQNGTKVGNADVDPVTIGGGVTLRF
ncbi:OmpW/AlkL family protein [Aidingimonas halophila]|uniref:Outer membrane protein n=1 Tax=Aidingimonas halophila TaxID=574349 RepID=A0A1H2R5X5_9GAMM|nr:OmpW family outer membrane protein [Aidingimonas halophila]GHC19780.1 outer membrane protein W [Aidingimonas halophila]SDW14872.1 outer membrane protein [Aidingimonas halophila]